GQGAETVVARLPASEEVDQSRWSVLQSAGFRVYPAMLSDTFATDAVHALATREGAGFVDLVAAFRAHPDAGLYFVVDEHWNARGQAYAAARLADAIAPRVAVHAAVRETGTWSRSGVRRTASATIRRRRC